MRCSRSCLIDEPFSLGLGSAVPLRQWHIRRRRAQSGTYRLFDRCQRWRPSLPTNRVIIEVSVELDVLRPALAATEPPMRMPPVGGSAVAGEDVERLPDRYSAVVPAAAALDEQIGALTTEILDPSDHACHARGLTRRCGDDKNMQ